MLTADEQLQIIKANREAFEELARQWRDPQTGSRRPDLKEAVINMLRDYFDAPGGSSEELLQLFSSVYDRATLEEDKRPPIDQRMPLHLTDENQIPDEMRAVLKRLGPDDDIPRGRIREWDWDEGEWDWEIELRDTVRDVDGGYVAIVPLKNGRRFEHRIKPPPSHRKWALRISWEGITNDILIRGSLSEAKRRLDMLLGISTPEIPGPEEW
jgi:hypothetical protein